MDVVYLVRPGDDNDELRHSLRTLANMPHDRVWFVGHLPSWATDVHHVPGNRGAYTITNVHDNVRIACDIDDLSDPFVMMNDDFFIMQPTVTPPTWWRDTLADHIASIDAWSPWKQSLLAAQDWLRRRGIDDPISYELHVPLLVDKAKMAEALDEAAGFSPLYPPQWRTVYGNRWGIGGDQHPDCKIGVDGTWDPTWPFLSCHDDSFANGPIGSHIRTTFPTTSPYEGDRRHEDDRPQRDPVSA